MKIFEKFIGWKRNLINSDTLVLDRYRWLMKNIPITSSSKYILDVGCGSGAFTMAAASLGYNSLGLSWDHVNKEKATSRAKLFSLNAKFEICDVRNLDKREDLFNRFDYVICTENIEHIVNDVKLMLDMRNCLKEGGFLLLTTPNKNMIPMWGDELEIINPPIEDGRHVRYGYDNDDLITLCKKSNFEIVKIEFCSGFFSQKITSIYRFICQFNNLISWVIIFPLRVLPILLDNKINYTGYSICLVAKK